MPRIWNKYLVLRRDGSRPDWPHIVLGARDAYAPAALRAYADAAEKGGEDAEYVESIRALAASFEVFRYMRGSGDPAAAAHRSDDFKITEQIEAGYGTEPDYWIKYRLR